MKRSKFTEAQLAFILRQGEEGTAVGEICRKGRNQRGHVLQLAQEVRWAHAVRDEATASARPAISTSGPISAVSRSTSPDQASPQTTPSSSHSMANFERNV
jgi:hypothetical protein